jgi:hypothetical protein
MELSTQEQQFFETGGETALEAPAETPPAAPETPPAEPATHAATETPVETPAAPEKPKVVPLEALHEARSINKDLREQVRLLNESKVAMEKRFGELMERLTPPKQAQAPAFEENPAEHLRTKVETLEQAQAKLTESQQQQAREAEFATWYRGQANAFAASTPDFTQAYESFISARAQEMLNGGMSPQEITAKVRQEERAIAVTAAQVGLNPAQMIYQAALAKGYKPQQKTEQPKIPAGDKLQKIAEGIKSGPSLSNVPGRPTENLTLESIANMPDSEFRKLDWDATVARLST